MREDDPLEDFRLREELDRREEEKGGGGGDGGRGFMDFLSPLKASEEEKKQFQSRQTVEGMKVGAYFSKLPHSSRQIARALGGRDTLVLAAGASLGFAQIGYLQVVDHLLRSGGVGQGLQDQFLHYRGSSIGALLSFFLYLGLTPDQVIYHLGTFSFLRRLRERGSLAQMLMEGGMITVDEMEEMVQDALLVVGLKPTATFAYLQQKFPDRSWGCATNSITTAEVIEYDFSQNPEMRVSRAMALSMAFPFLCRPERVGGKLMTDGGMYSLLPLWSIDPQRTVAILAVESNRLEDPQQVGKKPYFSLVELMIKILRACNYHATFSLAESCRQRGMLFVPIFTDLEQLSLEGDLPERTTLLFEGRLAALTSAILACFSVSLLLPPQSLIPRKGKRGKEGEDKGGKRASNLMTPS